MPTLVLDQPPGGYRINGDPFSLARFIDLTGVQRFLDVGAGAGALSLALLAERPSLTGVALEIDPEAARMACVNAVASGVADRFRMVVGDAMVMPSLFPDRPFDLVVANPPYYRLDASRPSPDPKRDMARREVRMTLAGLVAGAEATLSAGGGLALTMIAERRAEYRTLLDRHGFVETNHETQGRIFLSEARRDR